MRESDRKAFRDTANFFGVWIFLRIPNRHALVFIGGHGYLPKPIDCKAKTANRDVKGLKDYKVAGLVVSPLVQPKAFSSTRYPKAMASWRDFAPGGRLPANYDVVVDPSSGHHGCVRLNGRYLYADYDLYAIINPSHSHRHVTRYETLRGQPHRVDPRCQPVINHLNAIIEEEIDMVQHHSWWQGGHHSDEDISYFGPKREEGILKGHAQIAGFFWKTFGTREFTPPWVKG